MTQTIIFALLVIAAVGAWDLIRRNRGRRLAEERARAESERLASETRLAHEKAMADAKARDDARQQAEAEERSRKETEARENARLAEERRLAAEKLAAEVEAKRRAEEKALADAQVREAARLKAEGEAKQRAEAEVREKARLAAEEAQRAEENCEAEERARAEAEVREKMQIAAEEEARRQADEKAVAEKTLSEAGNIHPAGLTDETGDSAEKPLNGGAGRVRTKRKPGRYRGLQRRPTVAAAKNNSGASAPPGNPTGLATFRVLVQLTFAPRSGGVKAVRLIPYCSKAAPQELEVIDTATEDILGFTKLRDDCFTPIALAEVSEALAKGVRWVERSDSPNWCWAFGGRSLYVFAPGDGFGFSGFVSTECLWLNERHVVMLKSELRDKVSAALHEAGCSTFDILDETSSGVPQGWLVFKEVCLLGPCPDARAIPFSTPCVPCRTSSQILSAASGWREIRGSLVIHHASDSPANLRTAVK